MRLDVDTECFYTLFYLIELWFVLFFVFCGFVVVQGVCRAGIRVQKRDWRGQCWRVIAKSLNKTGRSQKAKAKDFRWRDQSHREVRWSLVMGLVMECRAVVGWPWRMNASGTALLRELDGFVALLRWLVGHNNNHQCAHGEGERAEAMHLKSLAP